MYSQFYVLYSQNYAQKSIHSVYYRCLKNKSQQILNMQIEPFYSQPAMCTVFTSIWPILEDRLTHQDEILQVRTGSWHLLRGWQHMPMSILPICSAGKLFRTGGMHIRRGIRQLHTGLQNMFRGVVHLEGTPKDRWNAHHDRCMDVLQTWKG